ncbi:S-layer homology domain-containing protein [Desulfotruncus alcoholivorax]|uniref:S-layer homology domain-containing protein n=1 Tax=Desulfotruncus alcoholivorax TaxID=265477 RepID=UPI000406C12F|nr:S-layer homology domain-containing protein [Desulfotruncus alcoholivorax]
MKRGLIIILALIFALAVSSGIVWAKPGSNHTGGGKSSSTSSDNSAGSSTGVEKTGIQDDSEQTGDNKNQNTYENTYEKTNQQKTKTMENYKAGDNVEYVTEKGLHVEIKDGKIEITDDVHKAGADEQAYEKKAMTANQFRQKYQAYNQLTGEGVDIECNLSDVKDHWAGESIQKMVAIGAFNGYEDGTFKPDKTLTQAEAIALVMRLAEKDAPAEGTVENGQNTGDDTAAQEENGDFEKVPEWAREAVRKAAQLRIVNMSRFHSEVQATRAQVAVSLAMALQLQPVTANDVPFTDGLKISKEDLGYILALYNDGIMKGSPDGKFNPDSAITRAEMAAIMERLIERSAENAENSETGSVADGNNNQAGDTGETVATDNSETTGGNGNTAETAESLQ